MPLSLQTELLAVSFLLLLRQMNDIQQDIALNFCDMCGCDIDVAIPYLQSCDWNIETGMRCVERK